MAVVLILRDYTTDENTLVSALLHDTLEDTDYTYNELVEDFGGEVANIVATLTEPKMNGEEKLSWLSRKKEYAKQLKRGSEVAVMISAADKAHNFRTTVEEYHESPGRFVEDFGSNIEEKLEAYQTIANTINSRLKSDIVHEFNHTFEEYKQFLFNVQASLSKEERV